MQITKLSKGEWKNETFNKYKYKHLIIKHYKISIGIDPVCY